MGRVMVLDEPPDDAYAAGEEGWEQCPLCKGTGVAMSRRHFEVYFVFSDEVEARKFSDGVERPDGARSYGIRAVEPDEGLFDKVFRPQD